MSDILPPGQPGQPQGGRLSEEEGKLIARLLSDPTYFPIEFRAWIKSYLESSGLTLPASQIRGGGVGARTGLPAGIILAYPASALPPDCLICNGLAILRNDFHKLFDIIGVTWGAGDGTTTFNIPDLRDRALYGQGSIIGLAATDGVAAGSRGGPNHHHHISSVVDYQGDHSHGVSVSGGISTDTQGDHSHNAQGGSFAETTGGTYTVNSSSGSLRTLINNFHGNTQNAGSHSHGGSFSGSGGTDTGGGHQHNLNDDTDEGYGLTPSYAGVVYCITTGL